MPDESMAMNRIINKKRHVPNELINHLEINRLKCVAWLAKLNTTSKSYKSEKLQNDKLCSTWSTVRNVRGNDQHEEFELLNNKALERCFRTDRRETWNYRDETLKLQKEHGALQPESYNFSTK
jgi:hypothetical protein